MKIVFFSSIISINSEEKTSTWREGISTSFPERAISLNLLPSIWIAEKAGGVCYSDFVNGERKFKVEFLYKVKFAEPSQENTTKGESVEFGTVEMEGTASTLESGDWSVAKEFDTKAEAITYLEELLTAKA